MNRGPRYAAQRARRKALKADAVVLLDRFAALMVSHQIDGGGDRLRLEIAEMRMRLAPPPGVTAPVVRTGYTSAPRRGRSAD